MTLDLNEDEVDSLRELIQDTLNSKFANYQLECYDEFILECILEKLEVY